MANGKERPVLISVIAILYFVFGILMLLGGAGIGLLGVAVPAAILPAAALGGGIAIAGIISLIIAGGFWNGWKAIWYLAVIFGILEIIVSLVSIFTGNMAAIVALIIEALLLYYIFRPKVKEFFGL